MLKLSEIRQLMNNMNLAKISKHTGLKYWNVRSVYMGDNPNYWHVEKVADHIETIMKNVSHETIRKEA
jgi:hypothetical protein